MTNTATITYSITKWLIIGILILSEETFLFMILFSIRPAQRFQCFHLELKHDGDSQFLEFEVRNKTQSLISN